MNEVGLELEKAKKEDFSCFGETLKFNVIIFSM